MQELTRSAAFSRFALFFLIVFVSLLPGFDGRSAAADAVETIRIGGTGSALATMRLLGEAFHDRHSGIVVKVFPSLGSSGGIKAVLEGDIDIAVASKKLSPAEKERGLVAYEYGRTPLVFVTHKTNPLSDITLKQVIDIYSGRMRNWPDNTPVRLVTRPAREASTLLLEGISAQMKKAVLSAAVRPGMTVAVTDQENADLLERLPGSFGVVSLCQLISENRGLKSLSLDGITPGKKTLADGAYRYYYDLYLVTGRRSSTASRLFVDFVFSKAGRSVLTRTGHLTAGRHR
ncbi:MAG: substrate-binding domain-containing protein [Nitrospiraceae bacterium]|nr:substrate-binding domain-containing protein [Nitrospiraceae bacterium]